MEEVYWTSGKLCWVPDDKQAFIEGRFIRRLSDDRAVVAVEGSAGENEQECSLQGLLPRDADQQCEAEMDNMKDLNEATVLHNIVGLLFSKNSIYSSVGPILIAMNPYKSLPIYGLDHIRECHAALTAGKKVPPHAYRTAEEVYQKLRINHRQAVVICGESGAGKTVTCKKMLEYLCEVANRQPTSADSPLARQMSFRPDPEKIVNANVVLESFGNAKTLRNDNSSRFGKFTKLIFDPEHGYKVSGCDVEHYLLERSRVCYQPEGERNYHIFFQLLCSGQADKYGLQGGPENFEYTKHAASVPGFDDAADFECLCQSMSSGGFELEVQQGIFEAVAAVLHLGNATIKGDKDASRIDEHEQALRRACELLGVDHVALREAITTERIRVPGQSIMKPVGQAKAVAQRDAVAKTIYTRLFKDMVDIIGRSLGGKRADGAVIGLLDIFGFEDMTTNGFEQMFINLTNERIQKLFNDVVIQRELQIYSQEGILGAAMFNANMDNSECVNLFTSGKPPGIIKLLTGQCQLGEEHDGAKFVQVLSKMIIPQDCWKRYFKLCTPKHAQSEKKTKSLPAVPRYEECFMIQHYCSNIMYTVQEFVTKSRDALLPHLHEVMAASKKPSIKILFDDDGSNETETVGQKFCGQLQELAEVLDSGETCFVRCIKSNARKLAGTVNRPMVLEQLLHGGVVAALEMRRSGLPERVEYNKFTCEFKSLERCACGGVYKFDTDEHCRKCGQRRVIDPVQSAKAILLNVVRCRAVEGRDFAFGNTRVFMSTRISQFLTAVKKLRWKHFARVVVVTWRFRMCAVKIRDIQESWKRLQAAKQFAQHNGFASLPRVIKVFQLAQEKLEPPHRKLEQEKLKHPTLDTMDANSKKKAFAQIAVAIGDWPGVKVAATSAETEVQRVIDRKTKAQEYRLVRVQKALGRCANMLETVEKIEADCTELADVIEADELAMCRHACEQARVKIVAAQTVELPALAEQLPGSVDLDSDGPIHGDLEIDESIARVDSVLSEADRLGQEILRVRGQFLLVARELEEQRAAKLEELSDLQTAEFVEEGLKEVVEIINGAWQRSAIVDDLLKAAKDGDAYRAAVEAFIADVDSSKTAVESGRETLERAKRERAERQKLYTEVSEFKGQLAEALSSITETEIISDPSRELGNFSIQLRVLMDEAAGLWGSERPLADWRTDIESWQRSVRAKLDELAAHRDSAREARRSKFASRLALFGESPAKASTPVKRPMSHTQGRSTAAAKIASEGMSAYSDKLLQIKVLIEDLQRAGADRGGVQSCLNSFVDSAFRGGGAAGPVGSPTPRVCLSYPTTPQR